MQGVKLEMIPERPDTLDLCPLCGARILRTETREGGSVVLDLSPQVYILTRDERGSGILASRATPRQAAENVFGGGDEDLDKQFAYVAHEIVCAGRSDS